jgi:HSP20 family protein
VGDGSAASHPPRQPTQNSVEPEKKEGRVLRSERHYGQASRSFTLASPVDEIKADAKYENGILELTLPKKSAAATRRLAVH